MIKMSEKHFPQLAERSLIRLSDLYDNLHTVLRFYKNNYTVRTTQK